MSVHLEREIERLKKQLLSLCAIVEQQVGDAVRALADRDDELATAVKHRDAEIDAREVDLEEECLKILALHQPVATDLRFVVAVMKINNDLERIGDLAVNIARKAITVSKEPGMETPFDLFGMCDTVRAMVRDSIDALINRDTELAYRICRRDDEVDALKREVRQRIEELMAVEPEHIRVLLNFLAVSRNLERIGDHSTNIAEDVIYMVDGRIIRHGVA